jgi:integrase
LSAEGAKFCSFNATFGDLDLKDLYKYKYTKKNNSENINALFEFCVFGTLEFERSRAKRGEVSAQSTKIFEARCRDHLLPILGRRQICEIRHPDLVCLIDALTDKGLHPATIRQILMSARKTFNWALMNGLLITVPIIPKVHCRSTPRGGFSTGEYLRLWRLAKQEALPSSDQQGKEPEKKAMGVRKGLYSKKDPIPTEFRWLIAFMVNSFVRPSDIKNLRHRHVEVVKGPRNTYLRLTPPESKRHGDPIITMRPAVRVYLELRKHMEARGLAKPDDYLFYPDVPDRTKAMMAIDHHFRRILERGGLRTGRRGQTRTLYSLRHTALTLRLMHGQGIDLLTLAKNARTSVEMVERFYASELNPEMNVAMLQSRRTMARELRHPWT